MDRQEEYPLSERELIAASVRIQSRPDGDLTRLVEEVFTAPVGASFSGAHLALRQAIIDQVAKRAKLHGGIEEQRDAQELVVRMPNRSTFEFAAAEGGYRARAVSEHGVVWHEAAVDSFDAIDQFFILG